MNRHLALLILLPALALSACQGANKRGDTSKNKPLPGPKKKTQSSFRRAVVTQLLTLRTQCKKPFGVLAKSFPISQSPLATCNYVMISGNIAPHSHKEHDEVFQVLEGSGIFYVGSPDGGIESHEVTRGSVIHVSRGTEHAYQHIGDSEEPTRGMSIFTPAYTTPDRHPAKWPDGSGPKNAGPR
jgi:mannose-6-phosphate isomerase-like protein (cupin superfamily)